MKEITVKTQKDYDKIKMDYDGIIRIVDTSEWLKELPEVE